jgi:hypothetical protein
MSGVDARIAAKEASILDAHQALVIAEAGGRTATAEVTIVDYRRARDAGVRRVLGRALLLAKDGGATSLCLGER